MYFKKKKIGSASDWSYWHQIRRHLSPCQVSLFGIGKSIKITACVMCQTAELSRYSLDAWLTQSLVVQ
jgi:hypothetical protein